MQSINRKPFQGLLNVIKFNWHFYVLGLFTIIIILLIKPFLNHTLQTLLLIFILISIISILVSLIVTFYVYDFSNFYTLNWLNNLLLKTQSTIINIHAGFDETSEIIQHKFSPSNFIVFDFYDSQKHTEVSIKRARKNAIVFPGTKSINTNDLNFNSINPDYIFILLAAHEIRNINERIEFFKKLKSLLKVDGKIIVAEHLRNIPNFIAYNIGAFHFFSKKQWRHTFDSAGFKSIEEIKINSFINTFVLNKE